MPQATETRSFFVGIDIGGTFTDLVLAERESARLYTVKKLTTHDNPTEGVLAALADAMGQAEIKPDALARVVHATTLATNLILEGKGARVGYVTTEGFGDLLQMGKGKLAGPQRYDLLQDKSPPPVQREMTIEARERMDGRGNVLQPLDEEHFAAQFRRLKARGADAYAICFMHAYASPAHERRVAEIIRAAQPGAYVALSSEVWPEFREFERATTTVMSATVGPVMSSYVNRLDGELSAMGVRVPLQIMQSNGGVASAATVAKKPIQCVESGPAAGVIGAAHLGRLYGCEDIICFDMGGTTAKAGLVRGGKPGMASGFTVGGKASFVGGRRMSSGFPIRIPTIDLAEVGGGGGSIAWVDSGGIMQVGPRSANSFPGPACYGRGGVEPTVTDADIVLGYLNPDYFLGGKMRLEATLAHDAIERRVAGRLGLDAVSAARGIYDIVNANMAAAVRLVTVERGIDPSEFSVIAFGGAGPAHIVEVVEEFNVKAVIIPTTPGLASAAGLLATDMTSDSVRTRVMNQDAVDMAVVNDIYAELEAEGIAGMRLQDVPDDAIAPERYVDARFLGQSHELSVPLSPGVLTPEDMLRAQQDFRDLYAELYGVRQSGPVQLVNFRSRIIGRVPKLKVLRSEPKNGGHERALKGWRQVYFSRAEQFVKTPVYDRSQLTAGDRISGPVVVEEADSTTVVPPGFNLEVGEYEQLVITR